jgi:sigma-B regulation protein RsbU (phosphoserine phosphatase)
MLQTALLTRGWEETPHPAAPRFRTRRALEGELAVLRREHNELQRSLYEAAHVQRNLCGSRQLRHECYEIVSEIFPVRHLSGDFISVMSVGDEIAVAIGDIAGKGLAAGMWFTHVLGVVRMHSERAAEPGEALGAINRDLAAMRGDLPLTTLFLARLRPDGAVRYSNAGHPPPLVLRGGGRVESLKLGGPLLGVLPRASYECGSVKLSPGDTLLGYSDGIEECRNSSGTEFGPGRIAEAAQTQSGSAGALLFSLLGAVEDFAGDRPREDDMALLVIRRMEN